MRPLVQQGRGADLLGGVVVADGVEVYFPVGGEFALPGVVGPSGGDGPDGGCGFSHREPPVR